MSDQRRISQKVTAGRDAFVAAGNLTVNVNPAGGFELARPGLLPRDVPAFTGRDDELAQLAQLASLAGGGRVVVSVIGGTAGVGKTALAVHAAHQLVSQFPDGQLYMDLRGYTEGHNPAEPGEVLQVFLRSLGVPASEIPAKEEDRSGLLRQVLARRRVLVILDNARTEAQVRPLLPGAGESLVLVTSRSGLPGLEADKRISLNVLSVDEAAAMLAEVVGPGRIEAESQAATEVGRLCGQLPLALRISGQLLATHSAWSVDKLAGMLADERDRLTHLSAGDLQVRATFQVSYGLLTGSDARLFRLLSLHPGTDFTDITARALLGTDTGEAQPGLNRLAEACLIVEHKAGRYGMHDLTRLFAQAICQESDGLADREAAESRLVSTYADVAAALDSWIDPRLPPAGAQEAEQAGVPLPSMREALEMFEVERPNLLTVFDLAVRHNWDEYVVRMSWSMGDSLITLGYLNALLMVRQAALGSASRTGDTHNFGIALNNLGVAYKELGRYEESLSCHQQAAAVIQGNGDRRGEGMNLNDLGEAYRALQRFDEAIDCYQNSLLILRETGDRYGESQTLSNLGIAYRAVSRFEQAIECHWESLAIKREKGDRRGEGISLNNLGFAYSDSHSYEDAVACYQQAAMVRREIGDRRGEAQTLTNLAPVYEQMRQFDKVIECYRQLLIILREIRAQHTEGVILGKLGSIYQSLQHPDQAAQCWREAATATRNAGNQEEAMLWEQLAASPRSQSRRRWSLLRRPLS